MAASAPQLGFTLDEVKNLLALEDGQSCKKTHDLAVKKLAIVETRVADLNRMRRMLKNLIAECETGSGRIACPIISTLAAQVADQRAPSARGACANRTD